MFTLVFLLIGCSNFLMANGKLSEKSTKQTIAEVVPRRVKRQIFDRDLDSQEYNRESMIEQPNRLKGRIASTEIPIKPLKRRPRSSNEVTKPEKKNTKTDALLVKQSVTTKTPLIKKPIPTFNELETYDDFQSKVMLSPIQTDNMEHEDEDFNVDDYDFDAAHDEFSGRGKPLVPRQFTKPPKKETAADKTASIRSDDKKKKKSEGEKSNSQGKNYKKPADLSLGIIQIPEAVSKDSKSENNKLWKIEKGYKPGSKKDLVGLASRGGVYDFVFYKK